MPLVNWSEATPEDLAGFTADFLREELVRRDLDTAGSKEEVINRLIADIAQNRLTTSQLPSPDSAAPSQRPNTTSPPTFDAAQSTELLTDQRDLVQQGGAGCELSARTHAPPAAQLQAQARAGTQDLAPAAGADGTCTAVFISGPSFSMFFGSLWIPVTELLSSPYPPSRRERMDTLFARTFLPALSGRRAKPGRSRQLSAGVHDSCGDAQAMCAMSMQVSVHGKDASLEELQPPGWTMAVKKTAQPQPNRPVETLGVSPAVPMDTHSEVRPARRKAPGEQIRNEELDFQMQVRDSIAEINKETLKHMAEAMASFSARTSQLEEELADSVLAVAPPSVAALQPDIAGRAPTTALHDIREQISRLADTVAAMQARSTHEERQRPAAQQKTCWYHRRYGNAARKCIPPCDHAGNGSGRH
ncbi:hypothetical protein HPB50_016228 [Hyalomma asiaticum]|uniref:Uncharacterized protein n=1 Tax=Hyalomma asiaticum TaxID=266040 RepID=A0ACB7RV05_HYAAI|nr:hypothetical protein HPB50_016228 [Hyalomma asiaticum]